MDEQVLQWCRRLIGCRSLTSEGTRDIVQLCANELLLPRGIEPRLIPSSTEGSHQVNLICKRSGSERDCTPLVLNTHLDTVPPGDHASWTECPDGPFAANLKDDRIYGLGTADTKLDFVAKALALAECAAPRRDVYLVATFGEEHGLVGAKEIAGAGLLPKRALAFVGEPSRLEVITAHKGLMVFQAEFHFKPRQELGNAPRYHVVFEGRSAHSSTPKLGLNAIQLAVEALASLPDMQVLSIQGGDAVNKVPARCEVEVIGDSAALHAHAVRIQPVVATPGYVMPNGVFALLRRLIEKLSEFAERAGPPDQGYAPPTLTYNPGLIHSSASSIVLEFELRPPPALSLEQVRAGIAALFGQMSQSLAEVEINLDEKRANPGFRSPSDSETLELALAALAAAELPLKTGVKAGCTEAGIYAAAGLQPVVFGPGPSTGVIHAPNEYNLLGDVECALRFYRELLCR